MQDITILIVEDEKKIADALRQGLEENHFRAEVAYDGKMALRLFRSLSPDLLIADINLPEMNGYELCRSIRASDPSVPILLLTAMNAVEDKIEGFGAGADDYLIKPFDFRELLLRIRSLLKRSQTTVATGMIMRAGDLQLNLDSKEVTRDGHPVQLTAKEFQLLEYLIRNKNRVLSRADIALHVWDIDFDSRSNVIDVYVNYLRKKIDRGFARPLLHTIVGMGYMLKESNT